MDNENIKKIIIQPGCVSCGTCQVVCPEVFEVNGISKVKQDADLNMYKEKIKEAASMCPVDVIEIVEK